MLDNYNVYHWMRHIVFCGKILAASDTESDCIIRCTWVLSPNMYMLANCTYNRSPVRDQCIHVTSLSSALMLKKT